MKILCVGLASYDITIPLENFPTENTKNRVPERIECGGGPSATAAYLLGKWGADVHYLGVVGNDDYGKVIKNEFIDAGVNIDNLIIRDDIKTTSAFVLVNKDNGSRTIFTYRPSDIKLEIKDVELEFTPDVILFDGQEHELTNKLIERYPNAITIIDAGTARENVVELSHKVKYLATSKNFAENMTNIKIDYSNEETLVNMMTKMEEIYNGKKIIVTLEDHGSITIIDEKIKWIKSIPMKQIDSTGAGDIFHGALTYFLSKEIDLEQAIKKSNIAGALSVRYIGTRNSVPALEEVVKVYNEG